MPQTIQLGEREVILVVDDDAAILEVCRLLLEAHNYTVLTAPDGAQALSLYQQKQKEIKLVVTDVMMPVLDGVALIKALRRIDPQVKVICASGGGARAKLAELENLHVQAFLQKPYLPHALLSAVDSVLRPSQTA